MYMYIAGPTLHDVMKQGVPHFLMQTTLTSVSIIKSVSQRYRTRGLECYNTLTFSTVLGGEAESETYVLL